MTGEGIAQALETATLAARAICHAGATAPRRAAGEYRRQVRAGMAGDDWAARKLSTVLAHERGANVWLDIADRSARSRRQFAKWMFEDYARAVMLTPHRWRRGLLHQPGPYRRSEP